jgi:site-specific recombinase XerD
MTKALASMLATERKRRDDQRGWLFPATRSHSKTENRQSMEDQFARAVIRAGLDPTKVTPHTMRHTAITRLVQSGVDLPTIQRISGHKTLTALMRYVHLTGVHIDAAMAKIDSPLPDAFTPKLHTEPKQSLHTAG